MAVKALTTTAPLEPPPRLLLGPGPSTVSARVLRAMSIPLVGHLDPAFLRIMDETKRLLQFVFQTHNEMTIPISGTGSVSGAGAVLIRSVDPGDTVVGVPARSVRKVARG